MIEVHIHNRTFHAGVIASQIRHRAQPSGEIAARDKDIRNFRPQASRIVPIA